MERDRRTVHRPCLQTFEPVLPPAVPGLEIRGRRRVVRVGPRRQEPRRRRRVAGHGRRGQRVHQPGRNRSAHALSQGVQARRKALRIRHIDGMEVRKKRPRGFKKEAQGVQVSPLNPLSVAPSPRAERKIACTFGAVPPTY